MNGKIKSKIASKVGGGLSKTIFKNSSLNALRTVLLAFLSFVTVPVVLHELGAKNYGAWALVIAFGSYSNFLEMGFNSAVTKLVAGGKHESTNLRINPPSLKATGGQSELTNEKTEKSKNYDIAEQINSTVITYFFVSLAIFLFVLICYPLIKNVMFAKVSVPFLDLYILGTLALNLMNLVTSNYFSVLTGRMRMDITNGITIVSNLIQTGFTIGLLFGGYGLMAVFVGSAFGSLINSVFPAIFAKREFPELFISLRRYNFAKIKHLFRFSLKMYFINSVSNFLASTNKFIIVRLTGLDFVAYYEIANKVVMQLRILFQNILEPVYPATTIVVATEDRGQKTEDGKSENNNKMKRAYEKAFKYLLITSSLGYGAMFLLSYPVFLVWLGEKFAQVSLITILIGMGNFVNLQTAIPFFFLASMNRLQKPLMSAVFVLVCNFVFGVFGYLFFGFYGLISGFSLGLILPSIWFILVGKREVVG